MSVQLIYYASKGNIDKIKECLNKGVHVDAANCAEETALYHAVLSNKKSCVQFLLKLGANPNRCSKEGFTPVNAACFRDNVKCLALLVRHGAVMEKRNEEHKESAIVTAIRHNSTKIIKLINSLKKEAFTKEGKDLQEQEKRKLRKEERKLRNVFPGASAVVPCIEPSQLRRPHDNCSRGNGTNVVLESALWDGSPVTVKRVRGQHKEYVALMLKDADVLSQLRHPQVALLMAVYVGPTPEYVCLVLEPFAFGSLYNLLHETQVKLDLDKRVDIMKGAAEGLNYLHDHQILHCYFNSYSVLIGKNLRAKIANLEYSQVNKGQRQPCDACVIQEKWMAPEQLRGEPPSIATDIYSFGATLWECLSRQVPWSWLVGGLVIEGRCLPILNMWPQCIKATLLKCLGEEQHRENISAILLYLRCMKNNGETSLSDHLDAGFNQRFQGKENVFVKPIETKTVRDDDAVSDLSVTEKQTSNIHILVRRRSLMHERHKITSHSGISHADQCWRQSEVDSYGYRTAEQIACARRLRRHSKGYSRGQWAKEVVVTRCLDGDSKRMSKAAGVRRKVYKRRHQRRGSISPENLQKLHIMSLKYERKVWARLQQGEQRANRGEQLLTDSLDQSEVELTTYTRTSSSQVLKAKSSQGSQKHCLKYVVSCTSSRHTGPGVRILANQSEDTKHDVRSCKAHTSTVYTGLTGSSPVSNGMIEVERKTATRPESDSILTTYRRVPSGDDVLRSLSDSKLSVKRREELTPRAGIQYNKEHNKSSQNSIPAPATLMERKDRVFSEKNKITEGEKIPAKSKEESGCTGNELQKRNKLWSADLPVKAGNDDVTPCRNDVTTCSEYAITTPMFVTTKAKRAKLKTTKSM